MASNINQQGRTSSDISYNLDQEYIAIPGTSVRIILEFPQYNKNGKTAIIMMDDAMTISYSVYRAKPAVILLGNNSVSGFGLGTKTVAGSLIRSVFTTDNLTQFQTKCYLEDQEGIAERLMGLDNNLASGLPKEDLMAFMKDDLTYFNIHICVVSETIKDFNKGEPYMKFETIIGAMILNSGQVYSIEDLITESTFSFQAKAVRSASNIEDYTRGFSTNKAYPSVTSLL